MDNFLDELKNNWQQAQAAAQPDVDAHTLLQKTEAFKKNAIKFQFGNTIILSLTLFLYILFFNRFLLFGTVLSKVGFIIMSVPLGIRIIAEIISIYKGRHIHMATDAMHYNQQQMAYIQHRKWIHGTLTYTVMTLYTLGFYFIMVQFSGFIPQWLTVIFCVAYPVVAWIIIMQVRKGIRKEMETLEWLAQVNKALETAE